MVLNCEGDGATGTEIKLSREISRELSFCGIKVFAEEEENSPDEPKPSTEHKESKIGIYLAIFNVLAVLYVLGSKYLFARLKNLCCPRGDPQNLEVYDILAENN